MSKQEDAAPSGAGAKLPGAPKQPVEAAGQITTAAAADRITPLEPGASHTQPPPPHPTPIQPAPGSEVGWILTGLGIAVSLGFNIFNYFRLSGLQRRIRRETVKVEEFRRVRTPIDTSLAEFRNQRDIFRGYADSGLKLDDIRAAASTAQTPLTNAFNSLAGALQDADDSDFANGGDWFQPVSALWDELVIRFDVVQNANRQEADVRRALTEIVDRIERIRKVTAARIDREMKQYTLGQ